MSLHERLQVWVDTYDEAMSEADPDMLTVTRSSFAKVMRRWLDNLDDCECWRCRGDRVFASPSVCSCGGEHLVTVAGRDLCGRCAPQVLRKAAS